MTLAVATETELRTELWRSFLSVLKSYAALANIGEGAVATNLDDSPWSIVWSTLSTDGRRRFSLNVCYDALKDEGMWRIDLWEESFSRHQLGPKDPRDPSRPFSLHEDGTVALEGSNLDMDHAAIELVGWFSNAIKTGRTEVSV
jgi:hypothetical protein